MIFFLATSVSSSIIITDRHEGIWDRSLVQGKNIQSLLPRVTTIVLVRRCEHGRNFNISLMYPIDGRSDSIECNIGHKFFASRFCMQRFLVSRYHDGYIHGY